MEISKIPKDKENRNDGWEIQSEGRMEFLDVGGGGEGARFKKVR